MKLLTIREMNGTIKIEELADGNCVSVLGRSNYKTQKSAMTQINRLVEQGDVLYLSLEDFAAEKARRRAQRKTVQRERRRQ
jgi:hypothetical protein